MIQVTSTSALVRNLALGDKELITLVGAGGKTTLMYALAKELLSRNFKIVTTTSTKIYPPEPAQSPALILGGVECFPEIEKALNRYGHITWAAGRAAGNKLAGVSLPALSALWSSGRVDFLIVEADGSAQRPVKAPNAHEPVVPEETTLFLSVVGLSALNKPLNKEYAFRPEIISRLTGIPLNASMTMEGIARLMVHPEGGLKGCSPGMRVVIILNQVDLEPEPGVGERLAEKIKDLGKDRISKVIIHEITSKTK
ncbi:MAG: putative selenium-dependent hydroxylase accessory protein YqeC [Deltaproteobacteria bacterium]|nr:putative selenium-dependent hydroxylase accessory protein YqeC [Deltaproteobacteria bacterium]